MWIKNKYFDIINLIAPGLLLLGSLLFFGNSSAVFAFSLWLSFEIADTGHISISFIRIFSNYNRVHLKKIYMLFCILIFVGLYLSSYFKIAYIYPVIFYLGIYHFYRQNYGIRKWYQYRSRDRNNMLFKLINLSIFILFHFRSEKFIGEIVVYQYPLELDFMFYPLLFLIILDLRKANSYQETLFSSMHYILYLYSAFFSSSFIEAFLPLVLSHGWQSIALSFYSEKKLGKKTPLSIFMYILIFFILGYSFFYFFESYFSIIANNSLGNDLIGHLIFSTYYSPIVFHYLVESYIWKRNNEEANLIFSKE